MTSLTGAIQRISPERFWRFSQVGLFSILFFFLSLVLLGTWLSVGLLVVLAALFVGTIGFLYLARDEAATLGFILVGFVSVVRYAEGFQIEEMLYGLIYLGYLAYWFVSRFFFYKDDVLRTGIDWALFLFLIYTTLSLALTPILGGEMKAAVSEWLSISMLAFYFPVKELLIRKGASRNVRIIFVSLGVIALFVALRNFYDYYFNLSQAEMLWQIASERVVMNEHMLMMGSIASLVFLLYEKRRLPQLVLTGLFVVFTTGAIIGQSRVVWVSLALGVASIFVLVDWRKRGVMLLMGLSGIAAIALVGLIVFRDSFTLILAGLTDRLFSLRTAATKDLSLINRFIEMNVAKDYILQNPVIGYGFGVPYRYFSLIFDATRVSSYVHNGYVGVLYRHGLLGFTALMTFYFGSIVVAFRVIRNRFSAGLERTTMIAVLSCLVAEALVAHMANPFAVSDTTLLIGILAGVASAFRFQVGRRSAIAKT